MRVSSIAARIMSRTPYSKSCGETRNIGSGVTSAGTRHMRYKLRTRRGKDNAARLRFPRVPGWAGGHGYRGLTVSKTQIDPTKGNKETEFDRHSMTSL